MDTFAKGEESDEVQHWAFHQSLHCLLGQINAFSAKNPQYSLNIITSDPSILYNETYCHPDLPVSFLWKLLKVLNTLIPESGMDY